MAFTQTMYALVFVMALVISIGNAQEDPFDEKASKQIYVGGKVHSDFHIDAESVDGTNAASTSENRILEGKLAKLEDFPFIVGFRASPTGPSGCVGSLLSPNIVLTAAHCVIEGVYSQNQLIYINAGSTHGRSAEGESVEIESTAVHHAFDNPRHLCDIALVKLIHDVRTVTTFAEIDDREYLLEATQTGWAAGWGLEAEGSIVGSDELLATKLTVTGLELCSTYYNRPIYTKNFCAGVGGPDTCQGDSGGPFVINGKLNGITVAGMKCGDGPAMYTDVTQFRFWIEITKSALEYGISNASFPNATILNVRDVLYWLPLEDHNTNPFAGDDDLDDSSDDDFDTKPVTIQPGSTSTTMPPNTPGYDEETPIPPFMSIDDTNSPSDPPSETASPASTSDTPDSHVPTTSPPASSESSQTDPPMTWQPSAPTETSPSPLPFNHPSKTPYPGASDDTLEGQSPIQPPPMSFKPSKTGPPTPSSTPFNKGDTFSAPTTGWSLP